MMTTTKGFQKAKKHLTPTGRKKTGKIKTVARRTARRKGKFEVATGKDVPQGRILTERDLI